MSEISLGEHLADLGWDFAYLSRGGDSARVGRVHGALCFEPFGVFQRTLGGKRLPIHQALPSGTQIKFLPSLKFDVLPNPSLWDCITHPLDGMFTLVAFIVIKLSGRNVSDYQNMPQLQGCVDLFANPYSPSSLSISPLPLTPLRRMQSHSSAKRCEVDTPPAISSQL